MIQELAQQENIVLSTGGGSLAASKSYQEER